VPGVLAKNTRTPGYLLEPLSRRRKRPIARAPGASRRRCCKTPYIPANPQRRDAAEPAGETPALRRASRSVRRRSSARADSRRDETAVAAHVVDDGGVDEDRIAAEEMKR